ncbi:MAG: S8 family peptidase, partial [Bdellovibrionota bacterium]
MENQFLGRSLRESYILAISCVIASLITAWSSTALATEGVAADKKASYPSVPGELIVRTRTAKGIFQSSLVRSVVNVLGRGDDDAHFATFKTDDHLGLVKLTRADSRDLVMKTLKSHPEVEIVEPNYLLTVQGWRDENKSIGAGSPASNITATIPARAAAGVPNDPDFAKTWGLSNTGQTDAAGQVGTAGSDIEVLDLWAKGQTGSRDILVAVIDTGIDWQHPDLVDNLYTNPGESGALASNGKDDDGNGYIDDVHGWNFNTNTNNSDDDHDHGTHCAGTIGASGDNGLGVAGVNWKVSLLPVKFLSASGSGSTAGAIESINYARKMKARVMSNSWGGGAFSDTLKKAIDDAEKAGILFVAASGNDGLGTPSYPAWYEVSNIVAVAATDNRDLAAKFSNV